MRIAMIGTGYVGLVSGVCFSDFGHDVVCVDKDASKIERLERGEIPIYEPGLGTLLAKNVEAGRLSFTLDLAEALEGCEAVFIAVGTPTRRGDGHADLTYVIAAAEEIAKTAKDYIVIVTKSTVPVGTNRKVAEVVRAANPDLEFDVASNPEFLREGAAIDDFMRPDRVIVGVETDRAAKVMADIYRPLFLRDFPIVYTDLESAEMIKYAANAFLATKITFINEIAALCERVGADVKFVSKGMGLDGRTHSTRPRLQGVGLPALPLLVNIADAGRVDVAGGSDAAGTAVAQAVEQEHLRTGKDRQLGMCCQQPRGVFPVARAVLDPG